MLDLGNVKLLVQGFGDLRDHRFYASPFRYLKWAIPFALRS